jgi:hypothetical protein
MESLDEKDSRRRNQPPLSGLFFSAMMPSLVSGCPPGGWRSIPAHMLALRIERPQAKQRVSVDGSASFMPLLLARCPSVVNHYRFYRTKMNMVHSTSEITGTKRLLRE